MTLAVKLKESNMKLKAVVVLLLLLNVVPCMAQYTHTGLGDNIENIELERNNSAMVNATNPYCSWGAGFVCWPQWTWTYSNYSYTGTKKVQPCAKIVDGASTYAMLACLEADYNGLTWDVYVKVIHRNLSTFSSTELLSIQVQTGIQLSQVWQRLYFTSNYCGTNCNRYDFKYSADGVNWSTIHSWTYGRSNPWAYAAGWLVDTGNDCTKATVHMDNWVKSEASRTPDLTDFDLNIQLCQPNTGKFCRNSTCVTNGQTLPGQ